jgi:uncharacterized protein (DUF1778 family)
MALAKKAARVNHQKLSQFLRDALLTAASECLEDADFQRSRLVILQGLKDR